jgi:release factor glutamine methyltransferase
LNLKLKFTLNLLELMHNKIKPSIHYINGKKLYLCKNVFNPFLTIAPKFLCDNLILKKEWKILEMGTGSGYIALRIAEKVKKVMAVDINPTAVRCAKINVKINNLTDRVIVLESNLFSNLREEYYDSIIFNPPYLSRKPRSLIDKSWCHEKPEKLIELFIDKSKKYLVDKGLIQVAYSNLGPIEKVKEILREKEFTLIGAKNKNLIWEKISVLYFKRNF